jgi:DNA phosphorothioation-associated putative methyltransferase
VGVGKRVGGAIYLHASAVPGADKLSRDLIERAEAAAGRPDWNVAKVKGNAVSLLTYETFDTSAFPALLAAVRVNLSDGSVVRTDYRHRANPPILHRKELLLLSDDPRQPRFRALTATAEEHGLFADTQKIGTRAAWQGRITDAGLTLKGHSLLPAHEEPAEVSRHKTAIVRGVLSQPMQLMLRLGIVTSERSLFDYGCGQGEDVAALKSQGYQTFGWDPHHAADGLRQAAAIVNLGFVLNVIEDPRERTETLKAAWRFAREALCVSVMVQGRVDTRGQRPHRDGYLTSRGTFQKYFGQEELRELVFATTGQQPLSLAPGILVAFRDKDLEQEVLLRRRSRAFAIHELPRPPRLERAWPVRPGRPGLQERLASILESLREVAFSLGRLPELDEAPSEVQTALEAQRVGWRRAVDLLREELSRDEAFGEASKGRRADLLVHMALQQFPGSPKYRGLPRSIQADIKAFFGSQALGLAEAQRLLFSAGDRTGIRTDAEAAAKAGLGGMRGTAKFRFASSTPRLPARLRVLVGCAEVLQGGVAGCDLVDIDLEAPRVAMLNCDDMEKFVPFVVERVKVDLGRLKVFADRREPETTPVYFKSKFLPGNHVGRGRQLEFESALAATGLFERDAPEPKWSDVKAAIGTVVGTRG